MPTKEDIIKFRKKQAKELNLSEEVIAGYMNDMFKDQQNLQSKFLDFLSDNISKFLVEKGISVEDVEQVKSVKDYFIKIIALQCFGLLPNKSDRDEIIKQSKI